MLHTLSSVPAPSPTHPAPEAAIFSNGGRRPISKNNAIFVSPSITHITPAGPHRLLQLTAKINDVWSAVIASSSSLANVIHGLLTVYKYQPSHRADTTRLRQSCPRQTHGRSNGMLLLLRKRTRQRPTFTFLQLRSSQGRIQQFSKGDPSQGVADIGVHGQILGFDGEGRADIYSAFN